MAKPEILICSIATHLLRNWIIWFYSCLLVFTWTPWLLPGSRPNQFCHNYLNELHSSHSSLDNLSSGFSCLLWPIVPVDRSRKLCISKETRNGSLYKHLMCTWLIAISLFHQNPFGISGTWSHSSLVGLFVSITYIMNKFSILSTLAELILMVYKRADALNDQAASVSN